MNDGRDKPKPCDQQPQGGDSSDTAPAPEGKETKAYLDDECGGEV